MFNDWSKVSEKKVLEGRPLLLAWILLNSFPCDKAEYCWFSYGSEDGVACKLYHPFGFTETGDMDGNEIIAIMELWDILIIDKL